MRIKTSILLLKPLTAYSLTAAAIQRKPVINQIISSSKWELGDVIDIDGGAQVLYFAL